MPFGRLTTLLAGGVLTLTAAAPLPVDTMAASVGVPAQRTVQSRHYRVHATILLLGMPIYTRKDVGSGFSMFEHARSDGSNLTSLQFGAGSDPARSKGLNRLGFFQELIQQQPDRQQKAAYFGFMTSSDEENLEQAKKAIEQNGDRALFKVISGTAVPGWSEATVYPVDAPVALQWPKWRELSTHLRANLPAEGKSRNSAVEPGTRTFLHAILESLQSPEKAVTAKVVYNGKLYTLVTSKAADGELMRLDGFMQANGGKSPFQIWYKSGENPLPVKIAYKPRGFLRLVFEADR